MDKNVTIEISGPISYIKELIALIENLNKKINGSNGYLPPGGNGYAQGPDEIVTENQAKRVYAIARSNGYSQDAMNTVLKGEFGYDSTWVIRVGDFDKICARFTKA